MLIDLFQMQNLSSRSVCNYVLSSRDEAFCNRLVLALPDDGKTLIVNDDGIEFELPELEARIHKGEIWRAYEASQ